MAQIATKPPTYSALALVTVMGPIGTPGVVDEAGSVDPIGSWSEWQSIYGGFSANVQDGPLAAKTYFDEGGTRLFTSRVVHCTTPGDTTTRTSTLATINLSTAAVTASAGYLVGANLAPVALANGQTLVIDIDAGGNATATFSATDAHRDSANGPFVLTDGMVLSFTANGVTVAATFTTGMFVSIGAATAAEVVAAINAKIATLFPSPRAVASVVGSAVRIATTKLGTGASLNVAAGTATTAMTFTTGALAGTGIRINIWKMYAQLHCN